MNQHVWKPEISELDTHFDVLTYDMWGHGQSALPRNDLELSEYTTQLLDLLSELGIEKAHVVGHSMGALIALDFATNHAAHCLSASALNPVFQRTPEQRVAVQKRAQDLADGNITMNITDTLDRWFGPTGTHPHAHAEELARNLLEAVNPEGYATAYRVFASADEVHASTLHELTVPAFFFTGEFDPNSTPEMSEAMAALVPNSHWSVLSGERHMMPLTAAPIVSDAIRDFVHSVMPVQD
jgi:pimeloyl-ACP methyl ester carboxylesterase